MPPKTKFSKQDVVDAAFAIAKEEGLAGVTARSVAQRLGSSVAPIYVNFETIEDLTAAVVQRVFALSDQLLERQQGPDPFANLAKASLAFAREYPVIFRELALQPNQHIASYDVVEAKLVEAMAAEPTMSTWTLAERKRLLLKMRVFQLGLSVMVANDHVPSWLDAEGTEALLLEVGDEMMQIHKIKREENKE